VEVKLALGTDGDVVSVASSTAGMKEIELALQSSSVSMNSTASSGAL
jgi:hypothetical protein